MPLPAPLRFMLARAALPPSHFPSTQKHMRLDSTLATEVLRSLVVLQDSRFDQGRIPVELRHCFLQIAKRDPSLVGGALQRTLLDPQNSTHGARLHFLVDVLSGSSLHTEEVSWAGVVRQAELALLAGKWHPRDLRNVLRGISIAGIYPPSLPPAAERYVAQKLAFADNKELGFYAGILTSLPETRSSPLMRTLADRATTAVGSPTMTLSALGSVCRSFLRAHYYDQNFVSKVAQSISHLVSPPSSSSSSTSSPSSQQQPPFSSAVAIFTLWSLAGFSSDGRIRTVDDEIAERNKEEQREESASSATTSTSTSTSSSSDSSATAAAAGGGDGLQQQQEQQEQDSLAPAFASLTKLLADELPENDDIDLLLLLLRGLSALRTRHWESSVSKELDALLTGVSLQCQAFLELDDPPISIDQLSSLLPKYFLTVKRRPHRLAPNEVLEVGVKAFCSHIEANVEEIIGVESPPFNLVAPLLDHGTPECKRTVIKMLEEAQIQDAALPTLQTMRFLLECADSKTFTAPIARYLRKNFSLSTEGIPLVQLTTAMMCFAVAEKLFPTGIFAETTSEGDGEAILEEKNTFVEDTLMFLERQTAYKWDLRCLMRLVSSLDGIIGNSSTSTAAATLTSVSGSTTKTSSSSSSSTSLEDQQRGRMTLLLAKKMGPLVDNAEPSKYPKSDAVACLTCFAGQISVVPDNVHKFLAACSVDGDDDSLISPSRWMIINDPASTIVERTLEQQKVDLILARLRICPIEDTANISKLVQTEYLSLFKHIHPDEVRFLFELFADRTIKQDKLLKEVLVAFMSSGSVTKVTIFSVASILNSCAMLRFAYIPLVKQMLASITDEQWSLIDAVELEMLLVALQRLGIRVPSILMTLGEKTLQLVGALTGSQAAALIAAFQQLGFYEEVVMSALVRRAAQCADSMSAITLSVLLGGPHAHRLPFTEENAAPIVRRLSEIAPELAPHQRTRIATTLKKTTSLPSDLLLGAHNKIAQLDK